MVLKGEPKGSSRLTDALYQIARRRYRTVFIAVIAIVILSAVWAYHTDLEINGYGARWRDTFTSRGGSLRDGRLLPPKIWQIFLPKDQSDGNPPIDPDHLKDTSSWIALNADYAYTLMGQDGGNEFVERHFSHNSKVVETYKNLANVGMKSDLLRYLLLDVEGGVYTDTDTIALKPIDNWVPKDLRDQVRLVVGIEFDRRDGGAWADIPHWLQFCQWTIAAAPGHPVFPKMVDRVLRSLEYLSEKYEVAVSELHPSSFDVMNSTGPAAWTDVVFEQLQEYEPSLNETGDLSFMTEPRLYGDILVLTIDGFGMGQPHSHSTNDGSVPEAALMRHTFRGSWREPPPPEEPKEEKKPEQDKDH